MYRPTEQIAANQTFYGTPALNDWLEAFDWDKPRGRQNVRAPSKPRPDIVLKDYFRDDAHFADLLNAFFFQGSPKVLPEALSETDSAVSTAFDKLSVEGTPDVIRRWTHTGPDGKEHTWVFFLENQLYLDLGMEVRVNFNREVIAMQELKKLRAVYQENRKPGPLYLSSIGENDHLPGITGLVAYYGHEPWNVPSRRTELVDWDADDSAPETENDRSINVFQAATQDLPFANPDNKALFQAIGIRNADIPATEKSKMLKDMLTHAPWAARDTYLRIWGSDAMRIALARGKGDKTVLALLEKDYKEIDKMKESLQNYRDTIESQKSTIRGQKSTIKDQKSTIQDQKSTIRDQKSTILDLKAGLLEYARLLLAQGKPATEVAAKSHLSLEEIKKL